MKKVLLFDDDEEILLLCETILKREENIELVTLSRCDDIVLNIETHRPDLILMDLWIPEIGGEKAISIAKNNEETKNIPILVFSANNDIKTISEKVNADGYLCKPFKIAEFKEAILKDYNL